MNASHEIFLETAHFLGARLCRDAIWAGSRCNWVGPAAIEIPGGLQATAHRSCGADLYSGTTGIAAFLARLYVSTGEKIFGLTAEAAMRQALSRLDDFPVATRIGFYTGLVGVADVLIELAEVLDMSKFAAMALLILEDVATEDHTQQDLGVIAGSAGAIPALLRIHRKQPKDFLLELASKHAEHLLGAASKDDSGLTSNAPRLTGFAQGSDGIAWALLELFHATQRDDFRYAAEKIFKAERDTFSITDKASHGYPPSIPATWFDGASGIGMTRLRAFEILGDTIYLDDARAATQNVTEILDTLGAEDTGKDFSLAHGWAGAAELLLYANRVFKDESHKAVAEQVGLYGIERYRTDNLPWPCGAPHGLESPNLMLGLAGIGYFYLRLHDSLQTPSILMALAGI